VNTSIIEEHMPGISFGVEVGIIDKDFSMALDAIQGMLDAGHGHLPASTILVHLVFEGELGRWPAPEQAGSPHFESVDSLKDQRICSVYEIADAAYTTLIRRGRRCRELEGQLHDALMATAMLFPGSKFTRHAQKIRRGPDSAFE